MKLRPLRTLGLLGLVVMTGSGCWVNAKQPQAEPRTAVFPLTFDKDEFRKKLPENAEVTEKLVATADALVRFAQLNPASAQTGNHSAVDYLMLAPVISYPEAVQAREVKKGSLDAHGKVRDYGADIVESGDNQYRTRKSLVLDLPKAFPVTIGLKNGVAPHVCLYMAGINVSATARFSESLRKEAKRERELASRQTVDLQPSTLKKEQIADGYRLFLETLERAQRLWVQAHSDGDIAGADALRQDSHKAIRDLMIHGHFVSVLGAVNPALEQNKELLSKAGQNQDNIQRALDGMKQAAAVAMKLLNLDQSSDLQFAVPFDALMVRVYKLWAESFGALKFKEQELNEAIEAAVSAVTSPAEAQAIRSVSYQSPGDGTDADFVFKQGSTSSWKIAQKGQKVRDNLSKIVEAGQQMQEKALESLVLTYLRESMESSLVTLDMMRLGFDTSTQYGISNFNVVSTLSGIVVAYAELNELLAEQYKALKKKQEDGKPLSPAELAGYELLDTLRCAPNMNQRIDELDQQEISVDVTETIESMY